MCEKSQCLKTARCGAPWSGFRINFTKCALANGGVIVVDTSPMTHAALKSLKVFKVGLPASCIPWEFGVSTPVKVRMMLTFVSVFY